MQSRIRTLHSPDYVLQELGKGRSQDLMKFQWWANLFPIYSKVTKAVLKAARHLPELCFCFALEGIPVAVGLSCMRTISQRGASCFCEFYKETSSWYQFPLPHPKSQICVQTVPKVNPKGAHKSRHHQRNVGLDSQGIPWGDQVDPCFTKVVTRVPTKSGASRSSRSHLRVPKITLLMRQLRQLLKGGLEGVGTVGNHLQSPEIISYYWTSYFQCLPINVRKAAFARLHKGRAASGRPLALPPASQNWNQNH